QVGEEGGVGNSWRAPLIARPSTVGSDDAVVVNADGDGLGVAEAVRRRVTAGAIIIVIQAGDGVKEEQAAEVGELVINGMAEALFQGEFNPAGEGVVSEDLLQLLIQGSVGIGGGFGNERQQSASDRQNKQRRQFYCPYFHGAISLGVS